jgi:O-acetylserine/cysteine efflux transporter
VDATTASLVLQTQVPIAIVLGWFLLGEALDARKIIGTAIALMGVAIVIGLPEQRPPFLPVLAIIGAGAVWALGQVLTRLWSVDTGLMVLKANALFGVPQLLLATLLIERGQWQSLVTAGAREWFYLAFVGIIGFYVAYVAWFTLLKRVRVDEATPFVLLMTPIGVLTAVFWLGEQLQWPQVLGGTILLLGLAVVSGLVKVPGLRRGKRRPAEGPAREQRQTHSPRSVARHHNQTPRSHSPSSSTHVEVQSLQQAPPAVLYAQRLLAHMRGP